TMFVDGYVVVGHVAADVVKKLLTERPPIVGIAIPGMPSGVPGMGGQK
ncbi:MAG TPA: CopG family transcriptional regulator, partial [Rhizobiales bacterium]|nr:CopG family transcriptional regulator [Hyphomicrobiales bacterium]